VLNVVLPAGQKSAQGGVYMQAAVLTGSGIEVRDTPKPAPGPSHVLVRVRAAGLNRADLIMAPGRMHGSAGGAGTVLGLEFAGDVEAVGDAVEGIKPGDRVMCSGSGGYAEFAVADWGRVAKIPANNMSYEEAATLPVALQTMHNALMTAGRLKGAETVLIQGASSGVGLMGLQIAKLKGARLVMGTSTNATRRARLKDFGADLAIDTTEAAWADAVLKATDGKGVDLIVDQVSGGVANENLRAAAVLGRIVNVGRLGGFKGEFDFDLHAMKRIDYIGVTFRTRSAAEVREINRAMRADLWDAVESGKLSLPIDRTFPLGHAAAALAHMRANAHFGKIVLTV
jgi:NADPH2:quinone reductase